MPQGKLHFYHIIGSDGSAEKELVTSQCYRLSYSTVQREFPAFELSESSHRKLIERSCDSKLLPHTRKQTLLLITCYNLNLFLIVRIEASHQRHG